MSDWKKSKQEYALADFLDVHSCDVYESTYNPDVVEYGDIEYLVLTDKEADERVKEYIKETVWAFNADFLSSFTGLPEEVFTALQSQCESANEAILALIEQGNGIDHFVEQSINADGRGHFLSSYDGQENEQNGFYIYRIN